MTRKIACLTLDVEADFLDPDGQIRLFDNRVLFDRYVDLLRRNNVRLTAFLVTSLLKKYGAAYRRLSEQIPVEFAIHSHMHDMQNPCSRSDIELSARTFREFFGVNPAGYRAPVGQITREGLLTLLDLGFRYDSSIYPSVRFGLPGYNNLHLPVAPFKIFQGHASLLEIPFASLSGLRLVFSLSYVKLFGWNVYKFLMRWFSLPDQVAVLSHPHDHYFQLLADNVVAWEKPFLQRNAASAFEILEKMLIFLREEGYQFELIGDLCDDPEMKTIPEIPLSFVVKQNGSH